MTTQEALTDLGVCANTLTRAEKEQLDRDGFLPLPDILSPQEVHNGDLKRSSLNARAALPGEGLQALHTDWGRAIEPSDYRSYLCRRGEAQQLDQQKYARPETLARLSPAARFVLDVF